MLSSAIFQVATENGLSPTSLRSWVDLFLNTGEVIKYDRGGRRLRRDAVRERSGLPPLCPLEEHRSVFY